MPAHLPIPENEALRLDRLRYYDILDSPDEAMFDDLTKLTAKILEVPICLISLVDDNRQWFKSRYGLEATQTPREISFCQYAIMEPKTFEINNALDDDRFKETPLVTQGPNIRFYAGAPLIDAEGASIGTLCAIDSVPRELDEEKRHYLELISNTVMKMIVLRREKLEAEKLARAKDEFLSNMSHEIRTPLNSIIGFNDLLRKTPLNPKQKNYLDTVVVSSQNLKVIINDILDVSKLESGNLELEKKPISLKGLIDHVIKLQGPIAKEKGIKLLCSVDHEIPEYVMGDETRLVQILINLVGNAIKFTSTGCVELKCLVNSDNGNEVTICFTVKDTGIGIDKDKLDTIFERFSQAETSTTRLYGGTGLGLSIVKMLVTLHGGKVWVSSERDKGSEFNFE
ncbi:MAG: ATP-binding protein, partial [Bacteroidota bacterium]